MKNIPFFSILIITILILSVNNLAYSENNSYGFSLGFLTGITYGQSIEIVYPDYNYKGKYLSELTWDMKPVFYLGLQTDFKQTDLMSKPGFFASASIKFGFPGITGITENRDWASFENSDLTHFSSHTNKTHEFLWADFLIGASIPAKSNFYLKMFLSGSWMRFAYSGRDGYGKYARVKEYDPAGNPISYYPINDDPKNVSYEGKNVIRYQQDWFLTAAGFSAGTNISPFFLELSFQITPFIFCNAKDEHLTNNKTFMDYTSFGLFIEPKIKIGFIINKLDLSIEGAYRYSSDIKGSSYSDIGNTGYFRENGEAGTALSLLDICFVLKYNF